MSKFNLLKHLIFSDLKRLRVYIPKLLIAVSILLAILGGAGKIISNNIYEKKSFTKIKIAYYLPDDTDKNITIGVYQCCKTQKASILWQH